MSGPAKSDAAALPPPQDRVYVDNSNLSELKSTTDDAVQNLLSRPRTSSSSTALASSKGASAPPAAPDGASSSPFDASLPPFVQSHFHTDLRLVLGFTAAAVMIGVSAWAYFVEPLWEKNKLNCAIAVAVYAVLSGIQAADSYAQGHTIFIGKRKMLSNRIETERLRIASPPLPKPVTAATPSADGKRWTQPPVYTLKVAYTRHANGGKSLLKSGKESVEVGHLGEWFTADGEFIQAELEQRLFGALQRALG